MLFITHRLQAYFLKITSGRWPPFTSMHCCKRVWKLPYTRLRRSLSIAATSSTVSCLSSWIVMIRHWKTRSYRNPHRKKFGTVRSGDRAAQAMSPKREITVPNISRTTAILFRTIWNGVLSSTVPLPANQDKLSRRRNIQIRNVSAGSAPLCIIVVRSVHFRWKWNIHIYGSGYWLSGVYGRSILRGCYAGSIDKKFPTFPKSAVSSYKGPGKSKHSFRLFDPEDEEFTSTSNLRQRVSDRRRNTAEHLNFHWILYFVTYKIKKKQKRRFFNSRLPPLFWFKYFCLRLEKMTKQTIFELLLDL